MNGHITLYRCQWNVYHEKRQNIENGRVSYAPLQGEICKYRRLKKVIFLHNLHKRYTHTNARARLLHLFFYIQCTSIAKHVLHSLVHTKTHRYVWHRHIHTHYTARTDYEFARGNYLGLHTSSFEAGPVQNDLHVLYADMRDIERDEAIWMEKLSLWLLFLFAWISIFVKFLDCVISVLLIYSGFEYNGKINKFTIAKIKRWKQN